MTLGDFVKQLVAQLQKNNVKIPFENEMPWHEVFYQLKKLESGEGKPLFFEKLRFDWDGSYPKCKQLSEFLHALHWNASVSAENPRYDNITLPEEITEDWILQFESLGDSKVKKFISNASDLAKKEFEACLI